MSYSGLILKLRKDKLVYPLKRLMSSSVHSAEFIREQLRRHSCSYEEGWCFFKISRCPNKGTSHPVSTSNHPPLYISKDTGNFVCFHCMRNGNLNEFIDMTRLRYAQPNNTIKNTRSCPKTTFELANREEWDSSNIIEEDSQVVDRILRDNVLLKSINSHTLIKWKVRLNDRPERFLIPSMLPDRNTVVNTSTIEAPTPYLPVGIQTFARQSEVIITDSVLDALSAYQGTGGKPTLAVRSEDAANGTIPDYVLACLEKFKTIYLWSGKPIDSNIGLIQLARRLGQNRCLIVNHVQSPRSCLQSNHSFKESLSFSFSLICNDLLKFDKVRTAVKNELEFAEKCKGTQWYRFSALNNILKGHRPGELTILTGNTGCGKTTFLSEYSLDLCAAEGVPTLWGSFEILNYRLAKTMLIQFAGSKRRLVDEPNSFDKFADAFSMLNLYFMSFHGTESIQRVSSTMAAAVIGHGIKHVIIDNLQFMLGMEYSNADRFFKQDQVIHMLRKFCTVYNCHITLVIHPRKECLAEGERLGIQSIFGSAKASQEADNVMIIQQEYRTKNGQHQSMTYLDIVKNRFDGDMGQMPLKFSKDSLSYTCTDSSALEKFQQQSK